VQVDQFDSWQGQGNFLATPSYSVGDKTTGCDGILAHTWKVLVTKDEGI
jgi:hypothetical protein